MRNDKFTETYDVAAEQKRFPRRFGLARLLGTPMYLRHDRQPGWSSHLPIYVRWCQQCQRYSISHPQGYAERIHCFRCRKSQAAITLNGLRESVLPVVIPALLICAAYAAFRLWWMARS